MSRSEVGWLTQTETELEEGQMDEGRPEEDKGREKRSDGDGNRYREWRRGDKEK